MDGAFWWRGLILGFSIAAPVGPIGVLCIRRTLVEGRWAGFISGLGAASADAFYGMLAAFGMTWVTGFLVGQQTALRWCGAFFLCYLGIKTFRTVPAEAAATAGGRSAWGFYGSTFLLTLTNPMTILSFVAVFAGLGLGEAGGNYGAATSLILGVFMGSALWWLLLSGGVGVFRRHLTGEGLRWVNRVSGLIILAAGLWALVGGGR